VNADERKALRKYVSHGWAITAKQVEPLLDALDAETARADAVVRLVKELDGLLACYRTGTNPGARLDRIAALRRALDGAS